MWPNPQETVDLVTFTGEALNGKLHFLCSVCYKYLLHEYLNLVYFYKDKISTVSLYGKIRIKENPYPGIFYAVYFNETMVILSDFLNEYM